MYICKKNKNIMANKYIKILIRFLKENGIYSRNSIDYFISELNENKNILPHLYLHVIYTYNTKTNIMEYSKKYIEIISDIYVKDMYDALNNEFNNLLKKITYSEFKCIAIEGLNSYKLSAKLFRLEHRLSPNTNNSHSFYDKILEFFTYEK